MNEYSQLYENYFDFNKILDLHLNKIRLNSTQLNSNTVFVTNVPRYIFRLLIYNDDDDHQSVFSIHMCLCL